MKTLNKNTSNVSVLYGRNKITVWNMPHTVIHCMLLPFIFCVLLIDDETIDIYRRTKKIFNEMEINLRNYCSNKTDIMQQIPEVDCESKDEILLGLRWDLQSDVSNSKGKSISFYKETFRSVRINCFSLCRMETSSPGIMEEKMHLGRTSTKRTHWHEIMAQCM